METSTSNRWASTPETPMTAEQIAYMRPITAPGVIEHEIDDDLVLYDPRTDAVHVLNETAAAVWWLCDGRRSGLQIANQIAELFGSREARVQIEVLETIGQLITARAVTAKPIRMHRQRRQ